MTTRAVWLEVALNGPWGQSKQPLIPISADAIVADALACADAGAAVIHLHPYDPVTGRQRDHVDLYAPIIERIRAKADVIVYPTIPFAGSPDMLAPEGATRRYAAVAALAERGLLEWSVVDPGSTNLSQFDDVAAGREGFVYLNPESHVKAGLALAARHGFHPSYAIYEPGFVRLGAALARVVPNLPTPIYRLMFSDAFTFGYPPAPYALDSYRALLADVAPGAPWMIAGLGVDIRPLIAQTVAAGGHVRVGLEDAPLGTTTTNRQWVEAAARLIEQTGARLATTTEIRAALRDGGRSR